MRDYGLSVAGVSIRLRTEHPLPADEMFAPFLTELPKPDIRAEFSCVDKLPPVSGKLLSQGYGDQRYETEEGRIMRFYQTSREEQPYAVSWEESDGTIRVSYLPEGKRYVSDFSNTFSHLGIEDVLIRFDRLCLHAACVETPLGGILFSGPSGIGKSTQAGLWCRYRGARQINGDRPAVSFDGERWLAWGMPYAGSSRVYVNDCCPIRAIVMLRQEKRCSVRRLGAGEAFRALWQGLAVHHWDRSFVEKASSLAMALITSVPVYEFGCTPDEAAVDFLEAWLRKEQNL